MVVNKFPNVYTHLHTTTGSAFAIPSRWISEKTTACLCQALWAWPSFSQRTENFVRFERILQRFSSKFDKAAVGGQFLVIEIPMQSCHEKLIALNIENCVFFVRPTGFFSHLRCSLCAWRVRISSFLLWTESFFSSCPIFANRSYFESIDPIAIDFLNPSYPTRNRLSSFLTFLQSWQSMISSFSSSSQCVCVYVWFRTMSIRRRDEPFCHHLLLLADNTVQLSIVCRQSSSD